MTSYYTEAASVTTVEHTDSIIAVPLFMFPSVYHTTLSLKAAPNDWQLSHSTVVLCIQVNEKFFELQSGDIGMV